MILVDRTGFTVTGRTFINYLLASYDRDDFLWPTRGYIKNSPKTAPKLKLQGHPKVPKSGKHTQRGNGGVSFGSEEGSFSGCLWPGVGAAISEAWRVFLGRKFRVDMDLMKLSKNSGGWGILWFGSLKNPVNHHLVVFSFKAMRASVTT